MKKLAKFFELNRPYKFDIGDITAFIYLVCAIGVICGFSMTIPFFIGSLISTIFCWKARRVNLVILNVAMLAMNTYYIILLFV